MKRLDRLVLKSFFGIFFLTTCVVTFILLLVFLLKYFNELVGKDLGFFVFVKLIFYFSLNTLQMALPLGVLLSSLMTFGNLGEHFELTAIKCAGISLARTMRPIFIFVIFLSISAFYFNSEVVPFANLKAYSLLYDIKQKKLTLDIKPGVFYQGIPNFSIKAGSKLDDGKTLLDVLIYDHSSGNGNDLLIISDSAIMYQIYNNKYMKLELFEGRIYNEVQKKKANEPPYFYRSSFNRLDLYFNLSSFDLKRTKEELFTHNRQMMDFATLSKCIDSFENEILKEKKLFFNESSAILKYHLKPMESLYPEPQVKNDTSQKVEATLFPLSLYTDFSQKDSLIDKLTLKKEQKKKDTIQKTQKKTYPISLQTIDDKLLTSYKNKQYNVFKKAIQNARKISSNISNTKNRTDYLKSDIYSFGLSKYKSLSHAFACIVMFLIGAPLGAIIKKGGFGVPVIIATFFFILYYVMTITGEKWIKAEFIEARYGVWTADLFLLPFGLYFWRQAKNESRLFDYDIYYIMYDNFKNWVKKFKK